MCVLLGPGRGFIMGNRYAALIVSHVLMDMCQRNQVNMAILSLILKYSCIKHVLTKRSACCWKRPMKERLKKGRMTF
jgi:biotin transporter BioY